MEYLWNIFFCIIFFYFEIFSKYFEIFWNILWTADSLPVRPSFFLQVKHLFFLGFFAGTGASSSSSAGWGVFLGLISGFLTSSSDSATDDDDALGCESADDVLDSDTTDELFTMREVDDGEVVEELELVDEEGWGSVCVEDVSVVLELGTFFLFFSLKQTEQRPSVSLELKKPHPLVHSEGKACCWFESRFWVLILMYCETLRWVQLIREVKMFCKIWDCLCWSGHCLSLTAKIQPSKTISDQLRGSRLM